MREGVIPSVLGTLVTTAGVAMRSIDMKKNGMNRQEIFPLLGAGVIGFGLAHLLLGGIDLVEHRR